MSTDPVELFLARWHGTECAVPLHHADGRVTVGKTDLHRRSRFVLEAKQPAAAGRDLRAN